MKRLTARLRQGAELVAAALFATLFGAFLIQVFSRYVMNSPTAWTQELVLVLYIWIIFWGCAFLLRERDHVAFDVIAASMPQRVQRVFAVISTALVVVAFLAALAPSYDFVSFMRIDYTPALRIRFNIVYSIFIVFLVAASVFGIWRLARLLGRDWRRELGSSDSENLL